MTFEPGPMPVGVAERHQQRAAGAEADDLGGHGGAAAAGLDRAHLADLGLEAGGLGDQADQVDHAAVAAVQVGLAARRRAASSAESSALSIAEHQPYRRCELQRGCDDLARALELGLDAGVDVAVGRAHEAPPRPTRRSAWTSQCSMPPSERAISSIALAHDLEIVAG